MNQYPVKPEQLETFDRAACVRNLFVDEPHIRMLTLARGQSIEERYLSGEIVSSEISLATHLVSMEAVADEVRSRLRATGELTDEDARQSGDEAYNESRRLFGLLTMDFAQQEGLAELLSPMELAGRISSREPAQVGSELVESAKNGYADFDTTGWSIFESKDAGPVLIMLAEATLDDADLFDVTYLDQIFAANPAFLQGLIRTHHEAEARHSVVEKAVYFPRLHEVEPSEVIPGFMLELSRIENPEQRAQEAKAILSYLDFMWAVAREGSPSFRVGSGSYDRQQLGSLQDKLKYAGVKFEDERQVVLGRYLAHKAQCPGESEDKRARVAELATLYKHVQELETHAPMLTTDQRRYLPILETPHKAMTAAERIQEIEQTNSSPDRDTRQRILPELKRILPLAEAFKQEASITDTDLRHLTRLSERDVSHLPPIFKILGTRHNVYTPLFNALALHRRGEIDMTTPVFKSFLRTFIGEENLDLNSIV